MTPNLAWLDLPAARLSDAEHAASWDALNARRANLPFLSASAMQAALRVFGRGDERLLIGRNGGRTEAMLLLQRCGTAQWQTFEPSQIPLGGWVAAPNLGALDLAKSLLNGSLGATLVLSLTRNDPQYVPREPDGPAWTFGDYIETGWIDVAGSFDDYWATRGKNLRSNLRKQQNRLAADGVACEFVELTAVEDMAPALARYGALESAGWKGREGTAIHPDNAQGRFYRELLEDAASRGEALVDEYRFDGRTVASNLCLQRDGVVVILKTTYDESVDRSLSPAFLLHHAQLQRFFAMGVTTRVEYYGRYMEWHSRWTGSKRMLHHLTCYRWPWLKKFRQLWPPRGRQAQNATEAVDARG